MLGLAPWRSSKARAIGLIFGLLPRLFGSVAPSRPGIALFRVLYALGFVVWVQDPAGLYSPAWDPCVCMCRTEAHKDARLEQAHMTAQLTGHFLILMTPPVEVRSPADNPEALVYKMSATRKH
jgi:hypothetical protein